MNCPINQAAWISFFLAAFTDYMGYFHKLALRNLRELGPVSYSFSNIDIWVNHELKPELIIWDITYVPEVFHHYFYSFRIRIYEIYSFPLAPKRAFFVSFRPIQRHA